MAAPLSYRGIADDIQRRIDAGEYPPGSALPSYRDLARAYGVSVSTTQRALGLLHDRGSITGVPGRGIYVTGR